MNRAAIAYVAIVCTISLAVIAWIFVSRANEASATAATGVEATTTLNEQVLTFATIMALPPQTLSTPEPLSELPSTTATRPEETAIAPTAAPDQPTAAPDQPTAPVAEAGESIQDPSPTPTVDVPTVEAQSAFVEYTIQRGDALGELAKRYNVSVRQILDANQIENPDSLKVGSVIKIPATP